MAVPLDQRSVRRQGPGAARRRLTASVSEIITGIVSISSHVNSKVVIASGVGPPCRHVRAGPASDILQTRRFKKARKGGRTAGAPLRRGQLNQGLEGTSATSFTMLTVLTAGSSQQLRFSFFRGIACKHGADLAQRGFSVSLSGPSLSVCPYSTSGGIKPSAP